MARVALGMAAVVAFALALFLSWPTPPAEIGTAAPVSAPPPGGDVDAAPPVAKRAPAAVPASSAVDPEPEFELPDSIDIDPERLAMIEADAELRERARQQVLAGAADARWREAVDGGGYQAEDVDPAVRSLFRNLTLEPRYAEGGRIEGLVIRDLVADHPLAEQGFRPGDRIDRIQGVPLRDPAEIPSLIAHLGPHFEVCAVRPDTGTELCREVDLVE